MADTNSEQDARAAFTAATGTVTPAAAKVFAEQMKARGLDPGPALRANGFADQEHSENQEATLDGNSEDGFVDPNRTNTGYLNPATKTPNFSALEAEKAYDTWTKMGLPEEQIKAALEAEGFQHVETGERDASDLENQFDAGFGGAAPGDYDLNGVYLGYETAPSELVGIDRDMRTMLGAMAYPNAAAKSLVADMLDASATRLCLADQRCSEGNLFPRADHDCHARYRCDLAGGPF